MTGRRSMLRGWTKRAKCSLKPWAAGISAKWFWRWLSAGVVLGIGVVVWTMLDDSPTRANNQKMLWMMWIFIMLYWSPPGLVPGRGLGGPGWFDIAFLRVIRLVALFAPAIFILERSGNQEWIGTAMALMALVFPAWLVWRLARRNPLIWVSAVPLTAGVLGSWLLWAAVRIPWSQVAIPSYIGGFIIWFAIFLLPALVRRVRCSHRRSARGAIWRLCLYIILCLPSGIAWIWILPSACESSKIVCDQDLLRLTGSILVGAVVSITIGRAFLDLVLALGRFDECSD